MRMSWSGWSLRSKLIAACVLIQLAAGALLVIASTRTLEHTLINQSRSEIRQVIALLDQAIAAPLAQRDYATLQQTLDLIRTDESINYLVLRDHRDKVVAASGWDATRELPQRDPGDVDLERADTTLHLDFPVKLGTQTLGQVDFGLSTAGLRQARADFLQRSLGIGLAALLVSMAVLAVIAFAITRHLARLAAASGRVAQGHFDVHVPVSTNDEIGRLGAAFNKMASALKQRVQALEASETQQRLHLEVARDEQSRLTALLGSMHSGIVFADADAHVLYANSSFAHIWSVPELAPGRHLSEIVPVLVRQVQPVDAMHVEAMLQPCTSESAQSRELRTLDGRIIVQRMQPVAQGTAGQGCIWFHDDVTLERQTQQRAHLALHDPLTSLFNRRGLYEALQASIAKAAAGQTHVALLFIDLDDFKLANDVAGHRTGDEILVAVARTLTGQMRKGELVARLGGDEFAVLCPGIEADEPGLIAARLVDAVAALRFETPTQALSVGCSIGVATYPRDALNEDDLVACADAAMYEAKQSGKNGWAGYRSDTLRSQLDSARMNWNARIHRAIQDQRLVLHFQSIHRASDLTVSHHEALVRMVDENDSTRVLPPVEFVLHAERSGKIRQIDRWVFEACVGQLAATAASVCIAVNLSARSLEDPGFPRFLREILSQRDVDPGRLHIELTETSAISDPMAAQRFIGELRSLGCAVHLDDFGSGFSSFAQLKLLDVDAIKIDGAFIRNLQSDSTNRLFVASMINIAHSLKKVVIAEHVEDVATLDLLRGLGVDFVQGFHFGLPGPDALDADASRPVEND
ncbi:MAG: EAL domain-containing protein [Burkholderiaceae bacterium]|nr:EAL domain-containing protein [Burkholderiaceae bacterium]